MTPYDDALLARIVAALSDVPDVAAIKSLDADVNALA